jgi:WD40 repeat protein
MGYVYIANIYLGPQFTIQKHLFNNDRKEKKDSKKMDGLGEGKSNIGVRIKKIEIFKDGPNRQTLFVFTERGMRAYRIKLGQQTQDIEGHTDSILNIVALDPRRLGEKTDQTIRDKPKLITCSVDNTIKLWDSKDMEVVTTLELDKSELSCMCFLENCCLVATG